MNPRKSFWLRNLMVLAGVFVAFGAIRFSRMQGKATGGDAQAGCGGPMSEMSEMGSTKQAIGEIGVNNLHPSAIDSEPLKRAITNEKNITTATNPDPIPLCEGPPGATSCALKNEWKNWVDADPDARKSLMRAITKCALPSTYSVNHPDGTVFPGQWGLYPFWKGNRLGGQDKRERMSACILSLLNGQDKTLVICIIGPGGSPFSDACTDPMINLREGGFFGDLFADVPRAYVVGPRTDVVGSGRICGSETSNYCCPEDSSADPSCSHKIIKAGGFSGTANRCRATAVAGSYEYCTEFFTTREPGRTYTNVFTSFVPSGT
jgi:hypothetical protein